MGYSETMSPIMIRNIPVVLSYRQNEMCEFVDIVTIIQVVYVLETLRDKMSNNMELIFCTDNFVTPQSAISSFTLHNITPLITLAS